MDLRAPAVDLMDTLYPTLSIEPDETVASWWSRLARLHGRRMSQLCADMRVPVAGLVAGHPTALCDASAISGVSEERLQRSAIIKDGGGFLLRGQRLLRSSLRRSVLHACPACLAEDLHEGGVIQAHGRIEWSLTFIRTCGRHALALANFGSCTGPGLCHDFSTRIYDHLPKLNQMEAEAPRRAESNLETYLRARLHGPTAVPHLDQFDWHAAARLCLMVGAVRVAGRRARVQLFTDEQWHAAGQKGFDVVAGGHLFEFLDDLRRDIAKGQCGPQAAYGILYQWLSWDADREAFEPVRRLIATHIMRTFPMAPGDTVLGQVVPARTVHSIRTASLEYGIHPVTLRKRLRRAGMLQPTSLRQVDNLVTCDAEAVRAVAEAFSESLPLTRVRLFLGADRVQTALLKQAGHISPVEGRYRKQDLSELLTRLLARAIPMIHTDDVVGIAQASRRSNRRAMEIVGAILDGRLRTIGALAEKVGYGSVLVSVSEVRRTLREETPPELPLAQVQAELGTSDRVITQLIAEGLLRVHKVRNPVNRCPMRVVARSELERFQSEFAMLKDVARGRKEHPRCTLQTLLDAGIGPVARRSRQCGAYVFRRRDLPAD